MYPTIGAEFAINSFGDMSFVVKEDKMTVKAPQYRLCFSVLCAAEES